ncbi:MAG: DNA helicase PcrA [Haliangiales bacterium]
MNEQANQETNATASAALMAALSPAQRDIAGWDEGPLLVLAGPGSGKTKVLTTRIARILKQSPRQNFSILGLTFTNKAADEMRARVADQAGEHLGRVFLGTFHSFCAKVLRQHGTHIGISPDFRIYATRADVDELLAEALSELEQKGHELMPGDDKLMPVIDRLRAKIVDPADAHKHVDSTDLAQRIGAIYSAYNAVLKAHNALDFPALLYETVTFLRRYRALAGHYQDVYRYWCIDEFQDTNDAQYQLLKAMAGDRFTNLFVVADDDQLIYAWNGASTRRFTELTRDFQPERRQLTKSYRCPPEIIAIANRVIRHNRHRLSDKQPLDIEPTPKGSSETIRLYRRNTESEEATAIAGDILKHHGARPQSVAILARQRKRLLSIETALDQAKIKYHLAQRRDAFESAPYVWLHACLLQSNQRREASTLAILCDAFAAMTDATLTPDDVMASADAGHQDYLRQWADMVPSAAKDKNEDSSRAREAARAVTEHLVRKTDYRGFINFARDWIGALPGVAEMREDATDPGNSAPSAAENHPDHLVGFRDDRRAWDAIYHDIRESLPHSAALDEFLHALELRSKAPPPEPNVVTLMTIHAAKGKEFDHVYLIGLAEDELPSYHARKKGPASLAMEEERRSFYVAITRACQTLTLSFAQQYNGYPKQPSRFLREALRDDDSNDNA